MERFEKYVEVINLIYLAEFAPEVFQSDFTPEEKEEYMEAIEGLVENKTYSPLISTCAWNTILTFVSNYRFECQKNNSKEYERAENLISKINRINYTNTCFYEYIDGIEEAMEEPEYTLRFKDPFEVLYFKKEFYIKMEMFYQDIKEKSTILKGEVMIQPKFFDFVNSIPSEMFLLSIFIDDEIYENIVLALKTSLLLIPAIIRILNQVDFELTNEEKEWFSDILIENEQFIKGNKTFKTKTEEISIKNIKMSDSLKDLLKNYLDNDVYKRLVCYINDKEYEYPIVKNKLLSLFKKDK